MVRRPSRALHTLYTSRRARTTSRADGPGMLYAFVDPGRRWKIGMTSNFRRRRAQWNRQCPCPGRRWMPPMAVKRRRRAETIALNKAQRNLSIHRKPVKRVEEYHSTPAVSGCKGVRILQVMYVGVTDSCARITLHLRERTINHAFAIVISKRYQMFVGISSLHQSLATPYVKKNGLERRHRKRFMLSAGSSSNPSFRMKKTLLPLFKDIQELSWTVKAPLSICRSLATAIREVFINPDGSKASTKPGPLPALSFAQRNTPESRNSPKWAFPVLLLKVFSGALITMSIRQPSSHLTSVRCRY
ncbi:hypothetical protein EV360DRAFT_73769 [Lentinula raphanica]|nr:hypothetical protein EV360DRAFT_73769 [Lentinula raphanica]